MNGQTINELRVHDYAVQLITLRGNKGDQWYPYTANFLRGYHKVLFAV